MVDFFLEHYIITLGVLFLFVALYIHKMLKWQKEKNNSTTTSAIPEKESPKIKEKEEIEFLEIKEFDDDEYVAEVFNTIFYSIQTDDDWVSDFTYDTIKFTKNKQFDRFNSKTISIEFEYKFDYLDKEYKKRTFVIKDIKLKDGSYSTFYFKDQLPIDVKKFLYDKYSYWTNEKNSKAKEKVDKSLKNIREVLGKASERGAKLDELLG